MTPAFIAALIIGWMVVSCLACVVVCMASSRFSARADEQAFDLEHAQPRRAQSRRVRRQPLAMRMESGAQPVKVKAG